MKIHENLYRLATIKWELLGLPDYVWQIIELIQDLYLFWVPSHIKRFISKYIFINTQSICFQNASTNVKRSNLLRLLLFYGLRFCHTFTRGWNTMKVKLRDFQNIIKTIRGKLRPSLA